MKFKLYISAIVILFIAACSKDRVEQDSFKPMDSFYNKYRQQEQEFVIDTGQGPCLLTGKQGTRLTNVCDTGSFYRTKDNSGITYPYKIKLIEIYTAMDMIT